MTHNQKLMAAIAAALSVGGVTTTLAGDLSLTSPVTSTPTVAIELFPDDSETTNLPASVDFTTKYSLQALGDTTVEDSVTVTYTLTGATWVSNPNSDNFVVNNPDNLAFDYPGVTDNTVTYSVNADSSNALSQNSKFTFNGFQIAVTNSSFADGATATLDIALSGGTTVSDTLDLVKSAPGTAVAFGLGSGNAEIDVAVAGKEFLTTSDIESNTGASIGTISISEVGSTVKDATLDTAWDFSDNSSGGTLTIDSGPFAASTSPDDVLVFIDLNDSNCTSYDDSTDIPATTVESSGTKAVWTISSSDINNIEAAGEVNICVMVPEGNTTAINETEAAPTSLLKLDFTDGQQGLPYSGTLRHIKRNGTICTVYAVPNSDATDWGSVRVTNRSQTGRDGVLTGTLLDKDANVILNDVDLLADFDTYLTEKGKATESPDGKIAPFQTIMFTPDYLQWLALRNGHETGTWPGRAVFTVGSDLDDMEVFLVGRKGSGPLMNWSLGMTGDGCN